MAGKAKRNAAAMKRKQLKKAAKMAIKDQYKKWAESGANQKSKRFTKRQQTAKALVRNYGHPSARCGNPGCKRCFPEYSTLARFPERAPRYNRAA